MNKAGFIALVVIAVFILVGKQTYDNSKIDVVKNASPVGYNNTYGRAFEKAFTNTKWKYINADYDVIEFNGRDRSGNDVVMQIAKDTTITNTWVVFFASTNNRSMGVFEIQSYIFEVFNNY
ncbi:MAG: hypothetical protein LBT59_10870 [Clostridiales bacterium]|jgi:predicted negative regulator of RcsB-dependent stress response|nr:hypothetical protein [Clostridiales bacterium]